MCTTHVYAYAYPDGRRQQSTRPDLCNASRHGQPCANNVVLKHTTQYVQYAPVPPPAPVYPGQSAYVYPPTPPMSSTPIYRSGDESDHSYRSSSSRKRRSSGIYFNGQRVVADGADNRRSSPRRERIVLVESPPTPRTPPQLFTFPHTAPSSPSFNSAAPCAPERLPSRRPVIVDERQRPYVQIEVTDAPRRQASHSRHSSASSRGHSRHSSASSRGSSRSHYSSAAEIDEGDVAAMEERRQRQRRRDARHAREAEERERELREKARRDERIRQRIADANAEISRRPAVPVASKPSRRASVPGEASGKAKDRETELVDELRWLNIKEQRLEERQRRAERELLRAEAEAQQARLRERMVPHRRASVGPGSRRQRVLYEDGVYRWE